ncbi:MAG: hypothetical protein U0T84_10745 [Chitinophagales bacterium]
MNFAISVCYVKKWKFSEFVYGAGNKTIQSFATGHSRTSAMATHSVNR